MSSARKATPRQVFERDQAEKCWLLIQPWKVMDVDFEPAFFFVSIHSLCLAFLLRRSAVCCSSLFCAREDDHQDSLLFL